MSDGSGPGRAQKEDLKTRLVRSFLTPVVAAAASAAAGWAAKRAPDALDRALPKLRSAAEGAGAAVGDLPARARSVAGGAGDLAQDLGERARAVVSSSGDGASGRARQHRSADELEQRRNERARGRAQRRKTRAR